jgi:hypothetical protein
MASGRQFESQPTGARGRYEPELNARPDHPSGSSVSTVDAAEVLDRAAVRRAPVAAVTAMPGQDAPHAIATTARTVGIR